MNNMKCFNNLGLVNPRETYLIAIFLILDFLANSPVRHWNREDKHFSIFHLLTHI